MRATALLLLLAAAGRAQYTQQLVGGEFFRLDPAEAATLGLVIDNRTEVSALRFNRSIVSTSHATTPLSSFLLLLHLHLLLYHHHHHLLFLLLIRRCELWSASFRTTRRGWRTQRQACSSGERPSRHPAWSSPWPPCACTLRTMCKLCLLALSSSPSQVGGQLVS